MDLYLRNTTESDLELLFIFQTDKEANYMAGFVSKDPNDKDAYMNHWKKVVDNNKFGMKSIIVDSQLVGSILNFDLESERNISYWLDKNFWRKGITTKAVSIYLEELDFRPLYARVAFDNIGSQRVLEKSGFVKYGEDSYFANARGEEIVEYLYKLKEV
jgi:RimJ/RimL family protein N-acetyltransferase